MTSEDLQQRLTALGITDEHINACRLPEYEEAPELVNAGPDAFDRPQQMTPETYKAWRDMKRAAKSEGINLKLVSAYRSVDYQCTLIQSKIDEGRSIDDILKVNAIPGHSEHHTGCALDLHAGDGDPLEESFEDHPAFEWLTQRAAEFGFVMSYPKDNETGIDYEPWHWCFHG